MNGATAPIYCAEQIRIPPELPDVLKLYSKHIIREQPKDIVLASAEYFARLSKSTSQQRSRNSGWELGRLEGLYNSLSKQWADTPSVPKRDLIKACEEVGIQGGAVNDVISLGSWTDKIPWRKFWGLAVASTSGTILGTMESIVRLISQNGKTPTEPLAEIFRFIAERDPECPASTIETITNAVMADPVEISQEAAESTFRTHLGGSKI